jgi:hypothetical protein
MHDDDAVAVVGRQRQVVGDEQRGHVALARQAGDQVHHRRLRGDVQPGGRLVGDQQAGRQASASAIITRWHMPPDISKG